MNDTKLDEATQGRLSMAQGQNPKRRLYVVDSPAGVLILGTPPRALYLAYRAMLNSDELADKAGATDTLLTACAVDPAAAAYIEPGGILEQFPGLTGNGEVVVALQKAAGVIKEDFAKK